MSLNCTISNIQFDYAFNDAVRKASKSVSGEATTFQNGIPNQTVLVFKTICCLPDEEINTRVIAEWYFKLFGVAKNNSHGFVLSIFDKSRNVFRNIWRMGRRSFLWIIFSRRIYKRLTTRF